MKITSITKTWCAATCVHKTCGRDALWICEEILFVSGNLYMPIRLGRNILKAHPLFNSWHRFWQLRATIKFCGCGWSFSLYNIISSNISQHSLQVDIPSTRESFSFPVFLGDISLGMLSKSLIHLSRSSSSSVTHQAWDWFPRVRQILVFACLQVIWSLGSHYSQWSPYSQQSLAGNC